MICHLIESIQTSEVLLWSRVKAQGCNSLAICRAINYSLYWGTISVNRQRRAEVRSVCATTTDLCWANHPSCWCVLAPSFFYVFKLGMEGHCLWFKKGFSLWDCLQCKLLLIINSKTKSLPDRLQWLLAIHLRDAHNFPAWDGGECSGSGCFPHVCLWKVCSQQTKLTACPLAICSCRSGNRGRVLQPSCSLHCHLWVTKRQARSCHWLQTSWLGNCTYAQAIGMVKEGEMRLWVSRRGQGTKPLGNWMAVWLRAVRIREKMM